MKNSVYLLFKAFDMFKGALQYVNSRIVLTQVGAACNVILLMQTTNCVGRVEATVVIMEFSDFDKFRIFSTCNVSVLHFECVGH